jgi:signal transduction histidine kinase
MKIKIAFGLSLFALMFFIGGIYIISTMETATSELLHRFADLHHILTLRKELLIIVERNQNNIKLKGTRYDDGREALLDNVLMVEAAKKCLLCHHIAASQRTVKDLENQIERYREATRKVLIAFPKSAVPERQATEALRLGDNLIKEIGDIIARTSAKLEKSENITLTSVGHRKSILYAIVTIGPFFILGFAFILIIGMTKPVNSLLLATRRLKSGDLDYRIARLKDEFGELAASFNEMAASLKEQMRELQRTEQLRVSGEMAAGIAHEIRNPLAGMKVSIEVLLSELELEEKDRGVLLKIIDQIRHIELLMKNLLNYARPVAAQHIMLDVNKILEKTVSFLKRHPSFSAGDAHTRIIKELDAALPEMIGDPQQLQQVFLNLFLNAADAVSEGGTITASTRYDKVENTIAIELHDTGQGIPAELVEKIFQPFFTTKGKGSGLGLAVSKRIIEEHGGSIMAMNNASGGATFRIVLPVKSDKGAPE